MRRRLTKTGIRRLLKAGSDFLHNNFVVGVLWNFVSLGLLSISGILIHVFIGAYFTSRGLGIFSQAYSIYSILAIFAVLGIHISVVKYSAEFSENGKELNNILSAAYISVTLTSLAFAILAWHLRLSFSGFFKSPEVALALKSLIIGLPLFSLNKVSMGLLNGLRKMKSYAVYQSLRWILLLTLILTSIFLGKNLETTILAFPATELILFLSLAPYMNRLITPEYRIRKLLPWIKRHLAFGSKTLVAGAVSDVNAKVDIIMIGFFMSDQAVGVYSLAAAAARGMLSFTFIIRINFNPVISKLYSEGKKSELTLLIRRLIRNTYFLFIPLAAAAVIVFPPIVRIFWQDTVYSSVIIPFYILLFGITLLSGFNICGSLLTQSGFPEYQLYRACLTLLFNMAANTLLIPSMGIIGAALATSASFLLTMGLLYYYTKRKLDIRIV